MRIDGPCEGATRVIQKAFTIYIGIPKLHISTVPVVELLTIFMCTGGLLVVLLSSKSAHVGERENLVAPAANATALHDAASRGPLASLLELLAHEARNDAPCQSEHSHRPLHWVG